MTCIGTTTFGFRYQLLDPAHAPSLASLVDQTRELGLEALQICENARPLEVDEAGWGRLADHAASAGVRLGIGGRTTDPALFRRYLERAASLPGRTLRLVFEEEEGDPPSPGDLARFLRRAAPALENAGVRLAIENHCDLASPVLAAEVAPYPADLVGFCVDTANSLRNFEPPERVMELLGPRAFCYHLKDYRVDGQVLGFQVRGAPLGTGRLDVDWFLDMVFDRYSEPEIYLENWVIPAGDRIRDIQEDELWLRASLACLRQRLEERAAAAPVGRREPVPQAGVLE